MNKNHLFILVIIGLFIIIGCKEEEDVVGPTPFIGGEQGLVASFEPMGIEEKGVYTIYEDESFPIQIILQNKGEENINPRDAKIKIYGILLSDFTGISAGELTNSKLIEGISELNPEGGEELIDFGSDAHYIQAIPGTFYDINTFASYTYRYKTHISIPKVCFKENLRDKRICEVEERKDAFSSGAPIQVKSVEEKPAGAGIIELDFAIENVDGGEVTKPGEDFAIRYGQLIYNIEPSTEVAKWRCTSAGRENEARLVDGKATIRCRLREPLPKDTLYTKAIGLTITYDYRDIISETVRIKKSI